MEPGGARSGAFVEKQELDRSLSSILKSGRSVYRKQFFESDKKDELFLKIEFAKLD